MRKVLAFILFLWHINFSMFIPQMDEVDTFDANGQPQDDINSIVEYVDQTILGNHDNTPEDEDDDSGQNLQFTTVDYFYQQVPMVIEETYAPLISQAFIEYKNNKVLAVNLDIITPPPKAKYFL